MTIRFAMHVSREPVAAQNAAQAAENAAQAQADANRAIENAIQEAERAARSVGEDVSPPPAIGGRNGTIIIPADGGNDISIKVDGKGIHVMQGETNTLIPIQDVVPRGAVDIAQALAATVFFLVVGWPIARAFARRIDRRTHVMAQTAALSAHIEERLATMERNIDTVAVETERLAEAQRFTTKLLAERGEQVPHSGQR